MRLYQYNQYNVSTASTLDASSRNNITPYYRIMIGKCLLASIMLVNSAACQSTSSNSTSFGELADEYMRLKETPGKSDIIKDLINKEVQRRSEQNETQDLVGFKDRVSLVVLKTRIQSLMNEFTANLAVTSKEDIMKELNMKKEDLENEIFEVKKFFGKSTNSTNVKQQDFDKLSNHHLRWRHILERSVRSEAILLKNAILPRQGLTVKQFCSQLALLALKLPRVSIDLPQSILQIGIEDVVNSIKNLGDANTVKAARAVFELFVLNPNLADKSNS